jgi:hypothetical protein
MNGPVLCVVNHSSIFENFSSRWLVNIDYTFTDISDSGIVIRADGIFHLKLTEST